MPQKNWDAIQRAQNDYEDRINLNFQIPKPRFDDDKQVMDDKELKQYTDDFLERTKQETLTHLKNANDISLNNNDVKIATSTQGGIVSVAVIIGGVPHNEVGRVNHIFDKAFSQALNKYLNQEHITEEREKSSNQKTNQSPNSSQSSNDAQNNKTLPSPFGQLGKTPQLKPPGNQNS